MIPAQAAELLALGSRVTTSERQVAELEKENEGNYAALIIARLQSLSWTADWSNQDVSKHSNDNKATSEYQFIKVLFSCYFSPGGKIECRWEPGGGTEAR